MLDFVNGTQIYLAYTTKIMIHIMLHAKPSFRISQQELLVLG